MERRRSVHGYVHPVTLNTAETMRFCTACGTQHTPGARFCRTCAKPVPAPASVNETAQADPGVAAITDPGSAVQQTAEQAPSAAAPPRADEPGPVVVPSADTSPAPDSVVAPEPAAAAPPASPAAPGVPVNATPATTPLPSEDGVHDDLSTRWAPPERRRRHTGLIITALLVLVAVAAGGTALLMSGSSRSAKKATAGVTVPRSPPVPTTAAPTQSPNPAPPKNPAAEAAQQISALLNSSVQARAGVVSATGALSNCTSDPATAVSNLASVVALRRSLLARSQTAPFAALPSGAQLKSLLTQAWTASLSADESYLSWAQDEQSNGSCDTNSAANDPNFAAASASSSTASPLKDAFSKLWNRSVAGPLHVPARTSAQI